MKTKTVTVALQLRVPSKMRVDEVKRWALLALRAEAGAHRPDTYSAHVRLYKNRIEVFAP